MKAGYKTALDIAEMVRKRLVKASQSGTVDPSMIWTLAQSFGAAKLDLGEELPAVVEHVIEQVGAANAGDDDPAAMLGFVADLVKQVEGDAFALFSCLNETSVGVPDESRAAMGMALLFSGEAAAAEASIGWLLDPATIVRRAAANALGDAARKGKVTPTMLRRMITMRNWLPEDSRPALDAAIATARRKGVPPAQWDDVEVRQLITTGIDGSGAIGVLAHCRNKRKNVFGSLVVKHGVGVRDAWAQEGITQKEIDRAFLDAASRSVYDRPGFLTDCDRPFPGARASDRHDAAVRAGPFPRSRRCLFGSASTDERSGAARHHRGRSCNWRRRIRTPVGG